MIGEILGNRYEIQEKIGEGGMSIVYKARCNKLNRYVAIKILKKELSDNEDIVNKFKREATAIAALSDNNIVNVLDVGTQDDINYIVMEYVKGKTLKEVIKQFGKLNYDTAVTIGLQIAKALECAHKNNIIHRDVKPQNILVTEEGVIKVTDFGIAKSSNSATLTNTTTIMGSAHYFSPEQAKGSFLDARTDLYSLGVVLYEMVTGRLPFEADSPVTIALKHIQEESVPPKQINSKIPDSLNKLILKAMEKDANMRYQTAKEIINDLQKIKDDPNAVIDQSGDIEDNHTIVMAAVNPAEDSGTINKKLEDEYYDDDEAYDDDDEYEYYDDEEDEDHKKGKKKMNKKLIIGIVSGIAVLLVLGLGSFFLFGGGSSSKSDVKVPDIMDMTESEAKDALTKVGLVYEVASKEASDKPEGTVIDFSPKSGETVKSGDKIRVILSSGQEKLKMIDVANGGDMDALNSFISKNKLKEPSVTEDYSDTVAKGKIISTNPEGGKEITKDTAISVVVSSGPKVKKVTVPELKGKSRDEAIALITRAGLDYEVAEKESDQKNKDKVIDVSHPSGVSVAEGTKITITVGTYTPPKDEGRYIDGIIDPSLTEAQAIKKLKEAGYNNVSVEYVDENGVEGKVIRWSPTEKVTTDKHITLYVQKKKEQPQQ